MKKIRVLVVDDTSVMRKIVSEVVDRDPEMETAGVAANGRIALQRVNQVSPDVITLDMEMPEMDGIEMVRELRKTHPKIPVIMLSALTVKGAEATFDALQAGASDYVAKPARSIGVPATLAQLQRELLPKIRHFFPRKKEAVAVAPVRRAPAVPRKRQPIEVVALATSTGGPNALAKVFEQLKEPLAVPVVIVQHMPPIFTRTLAERLDACSVMSVHEGEDGQVLQAGHAYVAPGGYHMTVKKEGVRHVIRLNQDPPENSCRPAADALFRSVAECYGASALAVVMTGMGRDGFLGTREICDQGGLALAQDQASSVVWGMPSFLAKEGLAESVLPLDRIADEISKRVNGALKLW
ncbi:chemotaxis response regulator protein-glutamate methylesterase [Pelagicoccus sp. SDUM812005]|uniref:protein-glutamate methylesterase/protein-glutamine glutaminase n=1 Tax=Pelagicoccus sp. SDUM812005 TaxID=3041257 RepID=UPI0028103F5A|nr:chemotaxis response regulator protein-glutamate methylesterase [Pelagicoccus sp. SDUM812005]MDQ8181251.1 chemotaxis response regulator protein-glutamate methylesterase [Pelagicoccus sp. SDUM812005]